MRIIRGCQLHRYLGTHNTQYSAPHPEFDLGLFPKYAKVCERAGLITGEWRMRDISGQIRKVEGRREKGNMENMENMELYFSAIT